jgi:predicted signal transduction protein with EAL and GGDEF domain
MGAWPRKELTSTIVSVAVSVTAVSTAIISQISSFNDAKPVINSSVSTNEIAETEKLRDEIRVLRADIQGVASLPKDTKFALQLQQTQKAVKDIVARQEKLEKVILVNPTKALEVPLLQRDLENVKSSQQANLIAVKEGVDRLYDLNKWLLGAMSVSILTLAINNFLKEKEKEKQDLKP